MGRGRMSIPVRSARNRDRKFRVLAPVAKCRKGDLSRCSEQHLYSTGLAASTIFGRWMVKVEPRPNSLSTVMSPPIIWQKRLLMTRPSPVPPYFRVVDASAWEKAWKSFPICSGVMPMPVSATAMVTQSRPFSALAAHRR